MDDIVNRLLEAAEDRPDWVVRELFANPQLLSSVPLPKGTLAVASEIACGDDSSSIELSKLEYCLRLAIYFDRARRDD